MVGSVTVVTAALLPSTLEPQWIQKTPMLQAGQFLVHPSFASSYEAFSL
jgi:hypothetical protein